MNFSSNFNFNICFKISTIYNLCSKLQRKRRKLSTSWLRKSCLANELHIEQ